MTIEEAHQAIGARVTYRPGWEGAPSEYGVITSANSRVVFVRYGDKPNAQATDPAVLTLGG